jgi:hypothetical protein
MNRTFSSSNAAATRGSGASPSGANSNGGWQRFDPSTRGSASGSAAGGNTGAARSYSAPQSGARSYSSPQSVRISPPIVQNRASGPSGSGTSSGTSSGASRGPSGAGPRGGSGSRGGARGGGRK